MDKMHQCVGQLSQESGELALINSHRCGHLFFVLVFSLIFFSSYSKLGMPLLPLVESPPLAVTLLYVYKVLFFF